MTRAAQRQKYQKKASQPVIAIRIDLDMDPFAYRKWGGEQHAKRGDWLVNNDGDVYTVDGKVFTKTYRKARSGVYVKVAPVWAELVTAAGSVKTIEGESHYKRGDYLVHNQRNGGNPYCVSAAKFKAMYRPAKA
jgi:hypothetical protein